MTTKIKKLEAELKKEKAKEAYAQFCSPGTFFSESSEKKCPLKDIKKALTLMKEITERHGAKPYGFQFVDGNGKVLTGMYYVTGVVKNYDEVPDDEKNNILRFNMKSNDFPFIIENSNSYRFTTKFEKEDILIDWDGNVLRSGKDKDIMEYRKAFKVQKAKEDAAFMMKLRYGQSRRKGKANETV